MGFKFVKASSFLRAVMLSEVEHFFGCSVSGGRIKALGKARTWSYVTWGLQALKTY